MVRITRRSWTPDQIDTLLALVYKGASPARASVVLGRPKLAVQNKARQLGKPFRDIRQVKAARLAREASELQAINQKRLSPTPRPGERLESDLEHPHGQH